MLPADTHLSPPPRGLTVRDVARRYRVGEDKVRGWIKRGELPAINTAATLCAKPRWVITPEALAAFEGMRAGGPPPKPRRWRRGQDVIDYYPDSGPNRTDHGKRATSQGGRG